MNHSSTSLQRITNRIRLTVYTHLDRTEEEASEVLRRRMRFVVHAARSFSSVAASRSPIRLNPHLLLPPPRCLALSLRTLACTKQATDLAVMCRYHLNSKEYGAPRLAFVDCDEIKNFVHEPRSAVPQPIARFALIQHL